MKCEFVKNFNASVNFAKPEKRQELIQHLMGCSECQEYVNTNVGAVLQRATPQDIANVAKLAEDDRNAI